jgi:hypothetical protein
MATMVTVAPPETEAVSSVAYVEILVTIIVHPSAPVYSFQARRPDGFVLFLRSRQKPPNCRRKGEFVHFGLNVGLYCLLPFLQRAQFGFRRDQLWFFLHRANNRHGARGFISRKHSNPFIIHAILNSASPLGQSGLTHSPMPGQTFDIEALLLLSDSGSSGVPR